MSRRWAHSHAAINVQSLKGYSWTSKEAKKNSNVFSIILLVRMPFFLGRPELAYENISE